MTARVYPIMYPMACLGCIPTGRGIMSSPAALALSIRTPPDVITTILHPRALAWRYISRVSAVFPE